MYQARAGKKKNLYACPVPSFLRDEQIRKVAKYARCTFDEAEEMLQSRPARFNRLLGWSDVKAEGQEVYMGIAKKKSERDNGHMNFAFNSKKSQTPGPG